MKLSEQLEQDHNCGDFGKALEGYSERAKELESKLDNDRARLDWLATKALGIDWVEYADYEEFFDPEDQNDTDTLRDVIDRMMNRENAKTPEEYLAKEIVISARGDYRKWMEENFDENGLYKPVELEQSPLIDVLAATAKVSHKITHRYISDKPTKEK